MKMSDGTEYFKKPPSGGIIPVEDSKESKKWLDDDRNVWETVRIEAPKLKGIWWRMKTGK